MLISDLDRLHTTPMGAQRIKANLSLEISTTDEITARCKSAILKPQCIITRRGKNYYAEIDGTVITVNAYSLTIITAHKKRG